MNEPTCADCVHFRRHYIRFDEFRFTEVHCGHCVHPRLKHRRPDTPACVHFRPPIDPETMDKSQEPCYHEIIGTHRKP